MCAKRIIQAESTKFSRTGELPPKNPVHVPPTPEQVEEKRIDLEAKATLALSLFEEFHSYVKVGELLGVPAPTIRGWLHRYRTGFGEAVSAVDLVKRLQETAPLALARVHEALLEIEDHKDAAAIGLKLLHGLGHLRTHQATKHEGAALNTNLTVTFTSEPKSEAQNIVEGSVVGAPRELQTAPDAED